MKKILQKDEAVLRQKAAPVPIGDITSPHIQAIIAEMKESLAAEDDGVGIAAPQIGYPLQIFIVSKLALRARRQKKPESTNATEAESVGMDESVTTASEKKDLICINPTLIKLSKEKQEMEEGCLSVRPIYGKVERSKKAILRAYDEKGELFERGGSGLIAQIFQHEIDHLNGVLFIDKATDMHEYIPE